MKNIIFSPMKLEDIDILTEIMKRAFDEDSRIAFGEGKTGGPEGYDNGEFLKKWGINSPSKSFKIYLEGKLIGGIILWINKNENNSLGTIFIDPTLQSKGIGTEIWKLIEKKYPSTKKWNTETPGFTKRNHNYYINKCGFKLIKIEYENGFQEENYILEKKMV